MFIDSWSFRVTGLGKVVELRSLKLVQLVLGDEELLQPSWRLRESETVFLNVFLVCSKGFYAGLVVWSAIFGGRKWRAMAPIGHFAASGQAVAADTVCIYSSPFLSNKNQALAKRTWRAEQLLAVGSGRLVLVVSE
jgi:hypothetical protein